MNEVVLTKRAQKQIRKIPRHIVVKLFAWAEAVELQGIEAVRRIPGFHDEPLLGQRQGQRSIRLSRAYRAIYETRQEDEVELISVEEVNKHEY